MMCTYLQIIVPTLVHMNHVVFNVLLGTILGAVESPHAHSRLWLMLQVLHLSALVQ